MVERFKVVVAMTGGAWGGWERGPETWTLQNG